jgi:hypothetical protein
MLNEEFNAQCISLLSSHVFNHTIRSLVICSFSLLSIKMIFLVLETYSCFICVLSVFLNTDNTQIKHIKYTDIVNE